jgi:hypothetical protein
MRANGLALTITLMLILLIGWTPLVPLPGGGLKIENRTNSEVTVNEINGSYCCTADKGNDCTCALSQGTHKLSVVCNGTGKRFERTVEIKDGQTTTLPLNGGC